MEVSAIGSTHPSNGQVEVVQNPTSEDKGETVEDNWDIQRNYTCTGLRRHLWWVIPTTLGLIASIVSVSSINIRDLYLCPRTTNVIALSLGIIAIIASLIPIISLCFCRDKETKPPEGLKIGPIYWTTIRRLSFPIGATISTIAAFIGLAGTIVGGIGVGTCNN